jgi:mannosylglycoprotein endo-beta-mannosidase
MDVLNSLFTKVGDLELLQPLSRGNPGQRISLYADDVVLFIRPQEAEMNLTVSILDKFGEASGLQTNLQKSCVIPIRCEPTQMELVTSTLPCAPADFPCNYLGLPVSTRKIGKAELLKWIEKISDKLPGWNAALMNMAGRVTWVHFVLSAIPIYALIAIKVPKWFL